MKELDILWQSYLSLEKELIEMSKFIYITSYCVQFTIAREI